MNYKYFLPNNNIDKYAIENAVKNNAWVVVPDYIKISDMEALINDMGYGDTVSVCHVNDLGEGQNATFLYADDILYEMTKCGNNSSIFVEV